MAGKITTLARSSFPESNPTFAAVVGEQNYHGDDFHPTKTFKPRPITKPTVTRPGFDRYCPKWTDIPLDNGETFRDYHGYDTCNCDESEVLWISTIKKDLGRANTLSEYITKKGVETGINFPDPVPKKSKNRKSKKQKAKSQAFQFTIKDAAFPSLNSELTHQREKVEWKKKKYSRLHISVADLAKDEDLPVLVSLEKKNFEMLDEARRFMEANRYYEDNGLLDSDTEVFYDAVEEQEPDTLDGPVSAISSVMKMLPDKIVQSLQDYQEDPLEIVSSLLGVAGYVTCLVSMQKQENNIGMKVGMTAMAVDHLHRIYKMVGKTRSIKKSFDDLSSDLTARMSDIEKQDDLNFSFNVKVAKTISAIGLFILSLFGIEAKKQMTDFLTFKKASEETFDLMGLLLWECLEIDITGEKLLIKQVETMCDEGSKFEVMLSQDLYGTTLEEAEAWSNKATVLDRALGKNSDNKLRSLLGKVSVIITEARKAGSGNAAIPAPASVALWGEPGVGKSAFTTFLIHQLANHFETDKRSYDMNTGKFFGHYLNERWGIFDEFGAAKDPKDSAILPVLNQVLSGNSATMPGAAVEDKRQYSNFTAVFMISNLRPALLDLGMTTEAHAAFQTRLINTEVRYPAYNTDLPRDAQTTRDPDFSHLTCVVSNPDGTKTRIQGNKFYLHIAEAIQRNQDNFMLRKAMLTTHAKVTTRGKLVSNLKPTETWEVTEDRVAAFDADQADDEPATITYAEVGTKPKIVTRPAQPVVRQPVGPPDMSQMPPPDTGFVCREPFTRPAPKKEAVEVTMDSSYESIPGNEKDSLDASVGRTLWITGPPGNCKTLNVVPLIKRYAVNTDTTCVVVKKTSSKRYQFEKPADPVGVIYILDDVVDPTTREGQEVYTDFYDEWINPYNATSVVISNFGPQKSYWNRASNYVMSWIRSDKTYTACEVFLPAFERRSGWTQDCGSRLIVTDARLSFFNAQGGVVVIDEFITSYLAGVEGDMPVNVHDYLPTTIPFTQEEADLWFNLSPGASSFEVINAIRQGASKRVLKLTGELSKINTDQFDVKVGTNLYKAMLEKIPDVKIKVAVGDVVLIGNGKDLYLSKASTCPYSIRKEGTALYVPTIEGNVVVTKTDYILFLTREFTPKTKSEVAIFNGLAHAESLDPAMWKQIEEMYPLDMMEAISIANKKMVKSVNKQKDTILNVLGVGAMLGAFALVLKYALSSPNEAVTLDEEQAARGRTKIRVKTHTGPPKNGKRPVCSDSDKFDDEEARREYEYAYDELSSPGAKFDWKNGNLYITKNYQYRGKNKQVRYNTDERHMEWGFEMDSADAAYLDIPTLKPAQEAFTKALYQNTVIVQCGHGESYGTMLSAEIGMVPLHTVAHGSPLAKWIDPNDRTYHVAHVKRIYDCPDREMCFFTLTDADGRQIKGPFKELYHKLAPMSSIAQVHRATMLTPNNKGGYDLLTGPFKLEATIQPALNVEIIHHWSVDIGYIHYGLITTPTMKGHCGLPYFAEANGKFYLLGVHAVSRPSLNKIGSVVCSTELWAEMCEQVEKGRLQDVAQALEEPEPDSFQALTSDYVRVEELDKISYDDHQTFETFIPKQILDMKTDITDDMLNPEGPGTQQFSGFDNKMPYDTKANFKHMGIPGMDEIFDSEKVPTLSEEEILANPELAAKVTPDKNGNLHVAYTRLSANSPNTGAPGISEKVREVAETLADFMIEEMGKENDTVVPLSIQEAISGTHTVPTFKRESAAGGVLGSTFTGCSKKADYVDYNEQTREVQFKGIPGKFVERWTKDQYELGKEFKRIHIPATGGLKSEKLLWEKIHKKRLFMIEAFPTFINQKRIFLPIQNLFTKYDKSQFTRFPLVLDPVIDGNRMANWLYEGTDVGASFDWSAFDLTVDVNLLHGVGYFAKRVYDRLGPKCNKCGNVALTLMQDMAAGSFVLGRIWLRTMGGVVSGCGCTSFIDVVVVMTAVFYVLFEMLEEKRVKMTRREIFTNVKTVHGGDDLKMAVSKRMSKYINLGEMCQRIKDTFGMTLTLDTKTEGEMIWRPFSECSFISRTFLRHPTFPVWMTKLKPESVASIVNWSSATTPGQQARQIEAACNEVFPFGEETYNKYRTYAMAHFESMNIPIDIPSYSLCGERLGTTIMTEESPAEFEERFSLLETPFASIRKHLRSPDLSKVVKTTKTKTINNTMPAKSVKSAFMRTLHETHDIADLILTPAFSQMAKYGATQPLPVTTIVLKDKSRAMSLPRNTSSLWAYVEFLTNTGIDMDRSTLASYEEFCKQWSKIDEDDCHTQATKWQKNLYYLLAKDFRFKFSELQKWATDTPIPDSLDGGRNEKIGHHHACVKCGELYYHAHPLKHVLHDQFANQCTNKDCEWYQGEETNLLKVVSYPAVNNRLDEVREARNALLGLSKLDLEFAVINIVKGNLTRTAELLCRANLSKPIIQWCRHGNLGKEERYINKLVAKFGMSPQVKEKFEIILPGFVDKVNADQFDRLDAGEVGENSLPMANMTPASGGASTGATPRPGNTSGATGHAAVDPTVNQTAAAGAEVAQPAAVSTGSAPGETILTSYGGLPTDMLTIGGYVNTILAFVYSPIALATIPVSADTLEFAVLYSWDINPFSEDCVGPYTKRWADLHQRFAGSFNVGLQTSSTAVIVGKIGLYHLPTGCSLPKNITRANMEIYDHTIIDLSIPSSEQLVVRPSNNRWFYIDRKNQYEDWGKIVVIAFTRISNTMGGTTSPPIYPTISLGEDAVYSLPLLSESSDIPFDIPPVPPMGTFMYTDGHNVDPLHFPNDVKATVNADGTIKPDWMSSSGRLRAEPSNVKYENTMNFYWGRRFPEGDTFAGQQHDIGFANNNAYRYALDFMLKDGKAAFAGLHSIAPEARIGKSYNIENSEGIGGTDQYAQVFPGEIQIQTISYIAADFEVFQKPGTAPWYGAYENQGVETPTGVNIVQYGESPASLRVRLVTREGVLPRTKFYEVRAENLGLQSAATVAKPTTEGLSNPAGYEVGPEVPSKEFNREIPDIKLLKAVVCNNSLSTTGQNVPPGFRLMLFWDQEDKDNWFGLPAVMPGIQGITTAMSDKQKEFKDQVRTYLERTKSLSYVLRATSAASSMGLDILVNQYGAFVYDPDMEYGVIPTKTDYFYMRYLSSDKTREWVTLSRPTPGLFSSRISVTRKHAGFLLDDGKPKTIQQEDLPLGDSLDGGAGMAAANVFGGLLSGVGQGLASWTDQAFQREMQKNKFQQDRFMQRSSLAAQTKMNARTNQAREYAAKHAADAQEWSANRNANAQVEVANLRAIGGNHVSTIFG